MESKRAIVKDKIKKCLEAQSPITPQDILLLDEMLDVAAGGLEEILEDADNMSKNEIIEKVIETIGFLDELDSIEPEGLA